VSSKRLTQRLTGAPAIGIVPWGSLQAENFVMAELGRVLFQARVARGLTIEEAERDTRISKRYLEALEREDFSAFPAPFYARAFLRTYAQYLGLDANQLLAALPHARLEPEVAPLPEISRPTTPGLSVNWVVAGIVVLFLLAAGLLLYRSGGSEGEGGGVIPNRPTEAPTTESVVEAAPPPVEPTIEAPAAETPTAEVPPAEGTPAETLPAEPQGRPIEPTEPGIVPDFDGAALDAALAVLQDKGMDYVLVEVENRDVPEGLVFDQSPSPGSELQDDESVTLVVSRATR
jgi:cytoskeletal protein RodZ